MTVTEKADVETVNFGGYNGTTTHVRGYQNYDISDQTIVALKNSTAQRSWTDTHLKSQFFQTVHQSVNPTSYADFGCNLGYYVFWSAQQGIPSLGIDYNSEYVHVCNAIATRHKIASAKFLNSNLTQWCESSPGVDLLTVFNVIHHLYTRTESYCNMHRLLGDLASCAHVILIEFPTENDSKGRKWTMHSDYSEQLFLDTAWQVFKSIERFPGQTEHRPYYLCQV